MAVREDILSEIQALQAQQVALVRRQQELMHKLELLPAPTAEVGTGKPGLGALYGDWKGRCDLTEADLDALADELMREVNDIAEDRYSGTDPSA